VESVFSLTYAEKGSHFVTLFFNLIPGFGFVGFVGDDLLAVGLPHVCPDLFPDDTQFLGEGVEDEFALVDVAVLLFAVFHVEISLDEGSNCFRIGWEPSAGVACGVERDDVAAFKRLDGYFGHDELLFDMK
jgi:hypothetical protein